MTTVAFFCCHVVDIIWKWVNDLNDYKNGQKEREKKIVTRAGFEPGTALRVVLIIES